MITLDAVHDADALSTALWLLVAQAGHHRCEGWSFEERGGLLCCACGAALYELRMLSGPDAPRAGPRSGLLVEEPIDDPG